MPSLRVLIVEDDFSFAIELSMLIEDIGYEVLKIADDSSEALCIIHREIPDIILMDIDIKGDLNGLQVVESIQDLQIPVLFITSLNRRDFYEKAKEMDAVGFLVKPVEKLTLRSSIELAMRNLTFRKQTLLENGDGENFVLNNCFFIKKNNVLEKVEINQILFVESSRNYVILQTAEKKYVLRTTMTSMEERLPVDRFLRAHRSYIINVEKIENLQLSESTVTVAGFRLPLGRSFKEGILNKLQTLE